MPDDDTPQPARRTLRWLAVAALALLGVSLAIILALLAFQPELDLGAHRARIESAAANALKREVAIAGPVTLVVGLRPTVELQGLRVGNPTGWGARELARIDRARATLALLPLLDREISIDLLALEGASVRLEVDEDGRANWAFGPAAREPRPGPTAVTALRLVELDALSLRAASVSYRDAGTGDEQRLELDTLEGSALRGRPVTLSATGVAGAVPFSVSATGGSLADLLDAPEPYPIDLELRVVDAVASARGSLAEPMRGEGIEVDLALEGEGPGALELLTGRALPPVGGYALQARLARAGATIRLSGVEGFVGETQLRGELTVDALPDRPRLAGTLELAALDLEPFVRESLAGPTAPTGAGVDAEGQADRTVASDLSLDDLPLWLDRLAGLSADVTVTAERVLGVAGDVRDVAVRAAAADGRVTTAVEVMVLDAPVRGELVLDGLPDRPHLAGTLELAELDLEPFVGQRLAGSTESTGAGPGADEPASPVVTPDLSLDDLPLPLDRLAGLSADVNVTAQRLLGVAADVRDAVVRVNAADGRVTGQVEATVFDVPLRGELALRDLEGAAELDLAVSSSGGDIGPLAAAIKGNEDLAGTFEGLAVRASTRGRELGTALEALELRLTLAQAALSYGNAEGVTPIPFTLDALALEVPAGGRVRAATGGTLLGEGFTLEASTATAPEAAFADRWPIALSAAGAGARLSLEGQLSPLDGPEPTTLDLELAGKRIGDLAVWLGATPDVALGYSVRARLTKVDGGVDLQALRASAGGTTVAGAVGASWRDQDLLLETRLRFESVDLDELSAVFGADDADDEARQGLNLYMPILPYEMRIVDANLDVAVDRVAHRRVDVTDLTFTGRIREGRLQPSPFSVRLGRTPLDGRLGLDLRSKTPVATLALRSADVDVGALLSDLDVFADFESTARLLEADVVLRGSTLKSILASSEVAVVIEDAVTTLRDRNTGAPLVVEVATGSLTASPGNAISYEARGRIGAVPVTLSVSTDPLATFLEPRERIPLRLTADLAGLQLALAASAARPISLRDLRFELSAEGTRLDSLNELLQVSVPPWGPYGFAGGVELDRVGYHGRNLRVRVGSSQLAGNVSLNTTGARPRLLVDLKSETLQLDDFRAGNWSAFGNSEASASIDSSGHDLRSFQRKKEAAAALVTRERVRALDARVTLEVKEVLSGRDRLGSGALVVTLADDRFSVESLTIDIPEGSLSAQFGFEIADGGFDAWTRAEIERLDYGVLARRIDPDSEPEGRLSLSVDLRSRSESLGEMLAGASGRFDFAVWPKNMQADVFDLWAANLVLAILPRLDTDAGPTINCVVGLLDMSDGTMTPKSLFIDTTNVQVSGTGEADFATQRLDFKFKPKAKRPKMFRLGTPIQVRGDFSDFRAGASPDEVVITAFRFATSVLAPLQRIFSAPVSADGEAACLAAMQRAPEPAR